MFFYQDIVIYRTNVDKPRMDNWYESSIELMEKLPEVKMLFIDTLKKFGTGIVDVKAKVENVDIDQLAYKNYFKFSVQFLTFLLMAKF